jgi:hypothetical protein
VDSPAITDRLIVCYYRSVSSAAHSEGHEGKLCEWDKGRRLISQSVSRGGGVWIGRSLAVHRLSIFASESYTSLSMKRVRSDNDKPRFGMLNSGSLTMPFDMVEPVAPNILSLLGIYLSATTRSAHQVFAQCNQ